MFSLSEGNEARALNLHAHSLVLDTLWGGAADFSKEMFQRLDTLLKRHAPTHAIRAEMDSMRAEAVATGQLPEWWELWEASGVDVGSVTIGTYGPIAFTYEAGVRDIAFWQRKFDALDTLVKVTKAKDIERTKAEGKRGIILNFQNTTQIGMDLANLDFFYDLGIRIMQLTYNTRNFVGNGCTERHDDGLSYFGLQVIERMNRLGMLIDLSHCGVRTTLEAIEASQVPVAVTHSFCRALSDHDRGKSDEVIRALGANHGCFCVMLTPWFITADPNPTLNHFLDHVDRAVDLIGVDKVGIGTDHGFDPPQPLQEREMQEAPLMGWRPEHRFDWTRSSLEGFRTAREWPNITRGLVARGYSDADIRSLLGGSFLRIFREVVG